MVLIGVFLLILVVAIILISKFKLEGPRVLILFLLPSLLFAFYGSVIQARDYTHIFEGFGGIFMLSLFIMSPALLLFATGMVWIEKKFKFHLFILVPLSVVVGGLSASFYLLDSGSLGKMAFSTALTMAPLAVLLEGLFYRRIYTRKTV